MRAVTLPGKRPAVQKLPTRTIPEWFPSLASQPGSGSALLSSAQPVQLLGATAVTAGAETVAAAAAAEAVEALPPPCLCPFPFS